MEVYLKAMASADEALSVDAANFKAKFRKANALEKLGDADAALKEIKAALELDPEIADLVKLKERLDRLQVAQTAKANKTSNKHGRQHHTRDNLQDANSPFSRGSSQTDS